MNALPTPELSLSAAELLGRQLFDVTREWRRVLGRRLRPHGLQEASWRLLLHLDLLGGEAPQARLAERLGIETPSLARLLDRMERDGWVQRHAHASDRRINLVRPTARGRAIMEQVAAEAAALRDSLLGALDARQIESLNLGLRSLGERLADPALSRPTALPSQQEVRP